MRNPARIDPLLELAQIWKQSPDLRLGQLLVNASGDMAPRLFHLEDDALLKALTAFNDRIGK